MIAKSMNTSESNLLSQDLLSKNIAKDYHQRFLILFYEIKVFILQFLEKLILLNTFDRRVRTRLDSP